MAPLRHTPTIRLSGFVLAGADGDDQSCGWNDVEYSRTRYELDSDRRYTFCHTDCDTLRAIG